MNLSDDQIIAALDALDTDGASYGFVGSDGAEYIIRLRIEPDDSYFTDIAEMGDCYGHTAWATRHNNDYGYALRPEGMDGGARKLPTRRGDLWWQPAEFMKNEPEAVESMYRLVRDIFEFGFSSVTVSLHETVEDSWGGDHLVEVRAASLGGVEPLTSGQYVRDIISDLLADLLAELGDPG